MNTLFSRSLIHSIQIAVLVMMAGAALANGSSLQKVVDGVTIYLARLFQCAVERRALSVGETPTRQLSLQPVAIGAAVEVTKQSKPLV